MQFLWAIALLLIATTTIWMALALYYSARSTWVQVSLALIPFIWVGALLYFAPLIPWALAGWFLFFVAILIWYRARQPKQDRDWPANMAVLPRVEIDGDRVTIRDFRNFDYDKAGVAIPHYEQKAFDLAKLRTLDFFLCQLSGPLIAHTLVSFGFEDDRYLAVSVEARREKGQKYSPLGGMFRIYELMVALGDERDIVRLRTNLSKGAVRMYRVNLSQQYIRQLLLDYMERANSLAARPEWYHSLISNCTTTLIYRRFHQVPWWLKIGVFVNGLSARSLYYLKLLDKADSFREIEARSEIRELAAAAGDASDFSKRIREHLSPAELALSSHNEATIPLRG